MFLLWEAQVLEKSTVKSFYEAIFRAASKSGTYIRYESGEKFDYVIYGSDQIWRKQNDISNVGYSKLVFWE